MKYQSLFILLLVVVITVSGCGGKASAAISPTSTAEAQAVEDQASFIAALQAAGAIVEIGDPITQAFFTPEGKTIKVNGADVQVFEYESKEAMENEAAQVAPDGGSVGTSMMMWVDTPHFYKTGRIIALYVGSEEAILSLLEKAAGPQFAGR